MRTPLVGWSVIPAEETQSHPQETPLWSGARCGNVNAIGASEIVSIAPGKSVVLDFWIGEPVFPRPGNYRVVFYYENKPDQPVSGLPLRPHDRGALRRMRGSTPIAARSNEIFVIQE